MEIMATSKNYGKKKVRITSGIFWTLMGNNLFMEKSKLNVFFFHNSVGDHISMSSSILCSIQSLIESDQLLPNPQPSDPNICGFWLREAKLEDKTMYLAGGCDQVTPVWCGTKSHAISKGLWIAADVFRQDFRVHSLLFYCDLSHSSHQDFQGDEWWADFAWFIMKAWCWMCRTFDYDRVHAIASCSWIWQGTETSCTILGLWVKNHCSWSFCKKHNQKNESVIPS